MSSADAPLLIGIDMGTASSKGVLTTADGTVVATAIRSRPHSMSLPRPTWAEVDPEAVWWNDVVSISRELGPQAGTARLAGVCVSGVGPCLLVCDEADRPVRPAILYGIDMRSGAEIAELDERLGTEAIFRRCGKRLTSQAVGPKMVWLAKHEPRNWAHGRRWFNSSSYVVRRLTGAYVLDHHTASQCDPLYDIVGRDWFAPWMTGIAEHLDTPRLAWPGEVVGAINATAARQTGLPVGTVVCAGTVDAWAEAFSAGVRSPGDVMLMYGSTMFFIQALAKRTVHPQLWTTVGVDRDSYTLAAGMATSGMLASWVRDLVGGVGFGELASEAARVPPGAGGLLMLPYFAGERTPVFDARARGVLTGLTLRHTRAHLYRAVYEGIAFGVRQIFDLLDPDATPVRRVVAVGGGTQDGLWPQIVSDVTGRPQLMPVQTIGACFGDALLAAIGSGLVGPETDWAACDRELVPDSSHRQIYDELYESYRGLYPATRPAVHRLARLQESPAGGLRE